MTGDYTKVPLPARRPLDGRAHAAGPRAARPRLEPQPRRRRARDARRRAADTIGPAGVVEGQPAFQVGVTPAATLDVTVPRAACGSTASSRVRAGRLLVRGPGPDRRPARRRPAPRSSTSTCSRSTCSRPRTATTRRPGARRRSTRPHARASATACGSRRRRRRRAGRVGGAHPRRRLDRAAHRSTARRPIGPSDPCAPPGDPLGQLPDGLFRVEVLDAGTRGDRPLRVVVRERRRRRRHRRQRLAGTAGHARPVALVELRHGDLVEVSWLARRADRVDHGALYTVSAAPGQARAATSLTLDRGRHRAGGRGLGPVRPPLGRRRSSAPPRPRQATLPREPTSASTFTAGAGAYEVGDWWGARVREEESAGIELSARTPRPDGIRHVVRAARARRPRRRARSSRLPADVRAAQPSWSSTRARARSRCSPATTCRRRSTASRPTAASSASRPASTRSTTPLLVKARKRIVHHRRRPGDDPARDEGRGRRGLRELDRDRGAPRPRRGRDARAGPATRS